MTVTGEIENEGPVAEPGTEAPARMQQAKQAAPAPPTLSPRRPRWGERMKRETVRTRLCTKAIAMIDAAIQPTVAAEPPLAMVSTARFRR